MTGNMSAKVTEALKRLAATSEEQEAYLLELGVWPSVDELALELDDALAGVALADSKARQLLGQLTERLEIMSGEANAHLWTREALRDSSEWKDVRILAQRVLLASNGT